MLQNFLGSTSFRLHSVQSAALHALSKIKELSRAKNGTPLDFSNFFQECRLFCLIFTQLTACKLQLCMNKWFLQGLALHHTVCRLQLQTAVIKKVFFAGIGYMLTRGCRQSAHGACDGKTTQHNSKGSSAPSVCASCCYNMCNKNQTIEFIRENFMLI